MFYMSYPPTFDLLADNMHIDLLCNAIELYVELLAWTGMLYE